jgi:uncharacterized protein with HEPN domain
MPHPDYTWVADILIAARKIRRAAEGLSRMEFEADEYRVMSVERLLITIGEAAKQVSVEFRSRHPEIPWRQMAGMRDLVVHAYRNINPDQVWSAVSISVPALIAAAEPLVPADPESDSQVKQ